MTSEHVETFAKVLGLPGLVVAVWYLLARGQTAANERAAVAQAAANERAEIAKAKAAEANANAVAEGFRSLSAQIAAHQTADLQSHAEMATALARVEARQEAAEARHERQEHTGERLRLVTNGLNHGDE